MRALIDIAHPAHAHFFRNPICHLVEAGHEVLITSRAKDVALPLLDAMGLRHHSLSTQKGGFANLLGELVQRDFRLWRFVRGHRPDVMAAIGGTFVAHVGAITGIASLVFYDTENARMQNAITYPVASCVVVPECYRAWVPRHRHIRYRGYHELSYLHPRYFQADRVRALAGGLPQTGHAFLIRLVSWKANHDIGESGWSENLLRAVVQRLEPHGKVIISAEGPLPGSLEHLRYGGDPQDLHHLMAFCRATIGESATVASESAVLGVPAIYAANTGRGYTDEQETRYGLVFNLRKLDWTSMAAAIDTVLDQPPSHWQRRRLRLLDESIDVARLVADCVSTFPAPLVAYQRSAA